MHYLAYVITEEPGQKAVEEVLSVFGGRDAYGDEWDYYTIEGGRWTHPLGTCFKVADWDGTFPHTYVEPGDWVPREYFDHYAQLKGRTYRGRFRKTPNFKRLFKQALKRYPNGYITVVDYHN